MYKFSGVYSKGADTGPPPKQTTNKYSKQVHWLDLKLQLIPDSLAPTCQPDRNSSWGQGYHLPFTTSTTTLIQDSVPKLKIDFLNNHCSDFD